MGQKILFLSRTDMMKLLKPMSFHVHRDDISLDVVSNLPRDAKVVSFHEDISRRGACLVIESESFPEVPDGNVIGEFRPEFSSAARWRVGSY